MGQNIISLGIDVTSFSEQKKKVLDEFILTFDSLSKYQSLNINPVLGTGFAEFNTSVKETNRLLGEINAKIPELNSSFTKTTQTVNNNTSSVNSNTNALKNNVVAGKQSSQVANQSTSEYNRLTISLKQQVDTYQQLILTQGKNSVASKAALADLKLTAAQLNLVDKQVENATGRFKLFGGGLSDLFGHIRTLAYILPGLGIAGIFNLAFEAIGKAAEATGLFGDKQKELLENQIDINSALVESIDLYEEYFELISRSDNSIIQNRKGELDILKAEGKSRLDILTAERKVIAENSQSYKGLFNASGGEFGYRDLLTKFDKASADYRVALADAQNRAANSSTFFYW